MREMKDSGIEWIGAIPAAWGVHRIASHFQEIKEKNTANAYSNALQFKMGKIIAKPQKWDEDETNETYSAYTVVHPNTIMINGLNLEFDFVTQRVARVECNGIITSAYIALSPRDDINAEYICYLLKSYDACRAFHSMGRGLRKILSYSELKNKPIVVPPLAEQERIAAFLDAECAEIDAVLEKTRASIEEYKKLKQAVITQAVTKGIRGDRPMKDSGIEWIGTCPLNWTVCRIKNVIFPQEKEVLPDDEIITCFRDGEVTLRKNRREDGFTVSFTEHGYHGVDKGDLVIHGMDAFAGAIGCSDSRGKTTPVVHTCKTAGNNRFFMYFLRSMAYGNILMDLSNGVRIRSSDFRNFAKLGVFGAVMPPLEEQNEIVDYIDGIVIQMDRLIQKKENLLTEIENYKKSLIYEYVTGKKEVV